MNIKGIFLAIGAFVLMQDVFAQLEAGTIGSSQYVCYDIGPEELSFVEMPRGGDGTYVYQWQRATDNINFSDIPDANELYYSPSFEEGVCYYRVIVTSDEEVANTNSVFVVGYPSLESAVISGSQTICHGTAPTGLTVQSSATGGNGFFANQWQRKVIGGAWTDIDGETGMSYNPSRLNETTLYRLESVSSYGCGTVYSNEITVSVYEELSSGSLYGSQTICYGAEPTVFGFTDMPAGEDGAYTYQWQRSSDGLQYEDILMANEETYLSGAMTTSGYYRCVVGSAGCGTQVATEPFLVTVQDEFLPGAITEAQTICYHTEPLSLSGISCTGGGEDYVYQWEQSADQGQTFSTSTGAGATALQYYPGALDSTTIYRLRYESVFGCGTVYSNELTVSVYPDLEPAVISGEQTICHGTAPTGLTVQSSATGGNGFFANQWQRKVLGGAWTDIDGETSMSYNPPRLNETTLYRLESVSSYGCGTIYSNEITVSVYEELSPGSLYGSQTICYGAEPTVFGFTDMPAGEDGAYTYQWQRSSDGEQYEDILTANEETYQSGVMTTSGYYRCVVGSAGCGTQVITEAIEVYVLPIVVAGTIDGEQEVCFDAQPIPLSVEINAVGGDGNFAYQWQMSHDGIVFVDVLYEDDTIYQPQPLTQTTWYRLMFINCDTVYSNIVMVFVNPLPTEKDIDGSFSVCRNANDVMYVLTQDQENIAYQWSVSAGEFTDYTETQTYVHWDDTDNDGIITLIQTDTITGCVLLTEYVVGKKEGRSPDKTNITRKVNSNILICQDNDSEINYMWGYIDLGSEAETYIENSNRQYVLVPHDIDTVKYKYFVETNYGASDCKTRSFYPHTMVHNQIVDYIEYANIDVWPNPAVDRLYIRLDEYFDADCIVSLKNSLGQTVFEKHYNAVNNEIINLDLCLVSGLYILVCEGKGIISTSKIIVE